LISHTQRKEAYLNKTRLELEGLAARGVVMVGNAFSSVLIVKGDLSKEEQAGAELLSGADGEALLRALERLGYLPEDWTGLSALADDGTPLSPELAREVAAALGPLTIIACDEPAADLLRNVYADELAALAEFDVAMLKPGLVARVAGMRLLNLGGFADSLADPKRKQWSWACLKRLPPLGEPY
jgi:hypothetical protein